MSGELLGRDETNRLNPNVRSDKQFNGLELPIAAGAAAIKGVQTEIYTGHEDFPQTPESIAQQLPFTYKAYQVTIEAINMGRVRENHLPAVSYDDFEKEYRLCFRPDSDEACYVAETEKVRPALRYILEAKPKIIAEPEDMKRAFPINDQAEVKSFYIGDELFKLYTKEELSGIISDDGLSVDFSLVPTLYTQGMQGSVQEQREVYVKLKTEHSFVRAPTLLDAAVHLRTLAALGYQQTSSNINLLHLSYMRHFDLGRIMRDRQQHIPVSFTAAGGNSHLLLSSADGANDTRLAIELKLPRAA